MKKLIYFLICISLIFSCMTFQTQEEIFKNYYNPHASEGDIEDINKIILNETFYYIKREYYNVYVTYQYYHIKSSLDFDRYVEDKYNKIRTGTKLKIIDIKCYDYYFYRSSDSYFYNFYIKLDQAGKIKYDIFSLYFTKEPKIKNIKYELKNILNKIFIDKIKIKTLKELENLYKSKISKYSLTHPLSYTYKLTKTEKELIQSGEIQIGMSELSLWLSWGQPDKVNELIGSYGVYKQYVYGKYYYVYVENGIVINLQSSE